MAKWKVIVITVVVFILTNGLQFFLWYRHNASLVNSLKAEISTLSSTIEALGPIETVYTVNGTVKPGSEILDEHITEMSLPSSMISEPYVTNPADIVGKLYKVAVNPGTPLTNDMIMDRTIDDTTRDVDIVVDRWTVGLTVGDYIDFRITLPYGDDYIAISHLRIESIGSATLKVYMNEAQWQIYQGALVDYYLNVAKGASIYVTKYVEPGVQKSAETYYAVPENVKAIMLVDPNIIDKAEATANSSMRESIKEILDSLKTENDTVDAEAGALSGGRGEYNTAVNADATLIEDEETNSDEPIYGEEEGWGADEDVITDGTEEGGDIIE